MLVLLFQNFLLGVCFAFRIKILFFQQYVVVSLVHFQAIARRLKFVLNWIFADRVGPNKRGKRSTVLKHMQWKLIKGAYRRGQLLANNQAEHKVVSRKINQDCFILEGGTAWKQHALSESSRHALAQFFTCISRRSLALCGLRFCSHWQRRCTWECSHGAHVRVSSAAWSP